MIKYFLKQLAIYLLIISGFTYLYLDNSIKSKVQSTVQFVYEAF